MIQLAVSIITVDRRPEPTYLEETIRNLGRAGAFTSPAVHSVVVYDSGPGNDYAREIAPWIPSSGPGPGLIRNANSNVAAALRGGARRAPWVLFLEDDIDVIANFFEATAAWLEAVATEDVRLYPLGAAYPQVLEPAAVAEGFWRYPLDKFYGTQAVALRYGDALDLADYLERHSFDRTDDGSAYDLLMTDWLGDRRMSSSRELRTPSPSFVQHIGRTSSIRPRPETHTFDSWPGRDWVYPIAPELEEVAQ